MQKDKVALLIDRAENIFPMNLVALTQAQGSASSIVSKNKGCTVLFTDGSLREIVALKIKGLQREGFAGKVISYIFGSRVIEVKLSDSRQIPLPDLKNKLNNLIRIRSDANDGWLDDQSSRERVINNIYAAENYVELFNALELPPPEDCLDLL